MAFPVSILVAQAWLTSLSMESIAFPVRCISVEAASDWQRQRSSPNQFHDCRDTITLTRRENRRDQTAFAHQGA